MKVCCDTEGRELTDERRYAPTSVPLRRKPCSRSPETLFHFTGIPSLRGEGAASRVLGVGHTLFDIALAEAHDLPVRAAVVKGISAPILVVSVEDEVTGTGSLVHRLIFGVTEVEGRPAPLRDWELLLVLNRLKLKSIAVEPAHDLSAPAFTATVDRLTTAFAAVLSDHATAFRRPISWPEMLLVSMMRRGADSTTTQIQPS